MKKFLDAIKSIKLRFVLIPLGVLLALTASIGAYGYFTAKSFMPSINSLQETGTKVSVAFQSQDLATAKAELKTLGVQLADLDAQYQKVTWINVIPFVGEFERLSIN